MAEEPTQDATQAERLPIRQRRLVTIGIACAVFIALSFLSAVFGGPGNDLYSRISPFNSKDVIYCYPVSEEMLFQPPPLTEAVSAQAAESNQGQVANGDLHEMTLEYCVEPDSVKAGESIAVSVRIRNTGNASLHNIYVVPYISETDEAYAELVPDTSTRSIDGVSLPIENRWFEDSYRLQYLNPGYELVINYQIRVKEGVPADSQIFSAVSVKADEYPAETEEGTPSWLQCGATTEVRA